MTTRPHNLGSVATVAGNHHAAPGSGFTCRRHVPLLGSHPQALINAQGVDDSDIVFALFGGRLGSPTPEAASGTAEEVDRALGLGKPVHLYFSTAPLPNDIDTSQLEALRRFKESMQERGLLGEFSNPEQLGYEVWRAIEHDISRFAVDENDDRRHAHGVDFLVQPHQEREVSGLDSRGRRGIAQIIGLK